MKPRKDADRVATTADKPLKQNPFGALASLSGSVPPGPDQIGTTVPVTRAPKAPTGRLVMRRETKHRGGKPVVVITGFDTMPTLDAKAVMALAAELKRSLGCGGTMEDDEAGRRIVLQGDDPARVNAFLVARGFRVAGVTR
jgi:translation initiation factor 1 (eIF-1/SUI1)